MEALNYPLAAHVSDDLEYTDLPLQPEDYEQQATEWLSETELSEAETKKQETLSRLYDKNRNPNWPCINMRQMKAVELPQPVPLIENFIYPGSLTILAADPKCGKSTFLFYALKAMQESKPIAGLRTRPAKCIYASEQPFVSLRNQIQRVPGYDTNDLFLPIPVENNYVERERPVDGEIKKVRTFPNSWEEQIDLWQTVIEREKASLFVVDTFSAFAQFRGGEAFDAGPVTTRLQQLKSLMATIPDLAIVVCHHLRKEDEQKGGGARSFHDIANSYALRAASDMNIIFYRPDRKEENKNLRTMKVEGRFLEEEYEMSFRKVGDSFQQEAAPVREDPYKDIKQALTYNPDLAKLSIRKLADDLKIDEGRVKRFKQKHPDFGVI